MSRGQEVTSFQPTLSRIDVAAALHVPAAANSGFEGQFTITAAAPFQLYVLNVDGSVTPLASSLGTPSGGAVGRTVATSDGVVHPVRIYPAEGHVDTATLSSTTAFTVTVPAGTDLSSYKWMVLESPRTLGTSHIEISDSLTAGSHATSRRTPSRVPATRCSLGSGAVSNGTATTPRP